MAHLNAAGITRLVTKLKERFAALAHTHAAATDITGQLPVANGGTGASTASGARTNLDAAQDNSSGITLADAGSNISTLLATTGIASTPSGSTLQGQIDTLQHSVYEGYTFGYFTGFVIRYGKLRILHLYNGTARQDVPSTPWTLRNADIPNHYEQVGSWCSIGNGETFASRFLQINTNGNITITGDVYRGGWTITYLVN